jgi:hypothetical protein
MSLWLGARSLKVLDSCGRTGCASRLVERGVPSSQVRDLLGPASIATTERCGNQRPEAPMEAAKRLETGQPFTIPSQGLAEGGSGPAKATDDIASDENDLDVGVDDGTRTRSLRSHSRKRKRR